MRIKLPADRLWFTADTHFGHTNIIKFNYRPFKTIEDHDEALIANWNAKVGSCDHVFHLGDFAFRNPPLYAERLNGHIHLVCGNHDRRLAHLQFDIADYIELKAQTTPSGEAQRIVLCHYPFERWNGSHHGTWHLHGHNHGSLKSDGMRRLDVGVDCWNYAPIGFEEVAAYMTRQPATPHHEEGT